MICFVYKMKKNNLKFETKNGKNLDKFLKLDSADKCILKATNTCLSCNGYEKECDRYFSYNQARKRLKHNSAFKK
jgi:hypothetical protein